MKLIKTLRRQPLSVVLVAIALSGALNAAYSQTVNRYLVGSAERITGDAFRIATRTPRGVTVIAASAPRRDVLDAIDRGFIDLFAVARRHGYARHLNFTDYTVFIGRPDRTRNSEGQYSPDIAVPAAQYAGGYYDQGGFVYASGMVLAFSPSAFVIAEHDRDMARISNIVRYEGEHIVLYYNDRSRYARTADHSRGGSHPILQ